MRLRGLGLPGHSVTKIYCGKHIVVKGFVPTCSSLDFKRPTNPMIGIFRLRCELSFFFSY